MRSNRRSTFIGIRFFTDSRLMVNANTTPNTPTAAQNGCSTGRRAAPLFRNGTMAMMLTTTTFARTPYVRSAMIFCPPRTDSAGLSGLSFSRPNDQ